MWEVGLVAFGNAVMTFHFRSKQLIGFMIENLHFPFALEARHMALARFDEEIVDSHCHARFVDTDNT